jgi:hypothetical protein
MFDKLILLVDIEIQLPRHPSLWINGVGMAQWVEVRNEDMTLRINVADTAQLVEVRNEIMSLSINEAGMDQLEEVKNEDTLAQ